MECSICQKTYSSKTNLNKHQKRVHKLEGMNSIKKSRITCVVCEKDKILAQFETYMSYDAHLEAMHGIEIKKKEGNFNNIEEFQSWMPTCYILYGTKKLESLKRCTYICNRNKTKDYTSTATVRAPKAAGSIKIPATCPSRIIADFKDDGSISVERFEGHVGHEDEINTYKLNKLDKSMIRDLHTLGVPKKRIIQRARDTREARTLSRLNLLTTKDIDNIVGDEHEGLETDDFAVGFMNSFMETKLLENSRLVCMDSTHNITIYKDMELTTLMIKDKNGYGFPVAFLKLREKVGPIEAKFFMSDDDIKFYNAWTNAMDVKPRRLLCSWHVKKNWNIQGAKKIINKDLRKQMKVIMGSLMYETNKDVFERRAANYLQTLLDANETSFHNYLQTYYFRSQDKIEEWAHCYRHEIGVKTNMMLESLHSYIKIQKLERRRCNKMATLLKVLQEVVDDKVWKDFHTQLRPTYSTFQWRKRKEHSRALMYKQEVTRMEDHFLVDGNQDISMETFIEERSEPTESRAQQDIEGAAASIQNEMRLAFERYMEEFQKLSPEIKVEQGKQFINGLRPIPPKSRKRKLERQSYFPS